jgi:transposase
MNNPKLSNHHRKANRSYWGVDVANGYIILNNGNPCIFYIFIDAPNKTPKLPANKLKACKKRTKTITIKDLSEIIKPNDIVILEQTGNYGIRYAQLISQIGAIVMLADSKMFAFFRKGRNLHKNDKVDAYLLRQMFFDVEFKYYIYKFIPEKHHLRQLIKSSQKVEKEKTRTINRLKNLLAVALPKENFHHLKTEKFIKTIPQIREKIIQIPHPYTETILISLNILENYEKLLKTQQAEIESIVKNHPDYELLSTIKGFGTKTIATLIAYYWDIKRFKTLNQFKGYLLKGTIREQSGISINRNKNIKSRPEVKKALFLLWKNSARRKENPLKHLVRLSYDINKKKAWLKFADKLIELIYYMLKYRLTFEEALNYTITNKFKEAENLIK